MRTRRTLGIANGAETDAPARLAQPLPDDELHIWWVNSARDFERPLLDDYARLMSHEELAREERLVHPARRQQFRIARALTRTTLSRYTGIPPAQLRFRKRDGGRPVLMDRGAASSPVHFSLSHTNGVIACLVGTQPRIGLDVERAERSGCPLRLAERCLAPPEVADLRMRPPAEQWRGLLEHWTLIEACCKARGIGITGQLRHLRFALKGEEIRVRFEPPLRDDSRHWHFRLLQPTPDHVMAIAAHGYDGRRLRVRLHHRLPRPNPRPVEGH